MEGDLPKYLPLAWLEDCLKQNAFINPQAWLHLARLRPKGTSGTVPIIPNSGGSGSHTLPTNKHPVGGYKEWQTVPDREKGAKVVDSMMKFEWKNKKKKDFFAYWLAQNVSRRTILLPLFHFSYSPYFTSFTIYPTPLPFIPGHYHRLHSTVFRNWVVVRHSLRAWAVSPPSNSDAFP
jgi:hypothetical protein